MNNKKALFFLPILATLIISCSTLGVDTTVPVNTPVNASPTANPTDTPTPVVPTSSPESSNTPEPEPSPYWTVYEDPILGFRFAVPCFWRVDFPQEGQYNPQTGVSYPAYNYPEEYPFNFPRSHIPDENGWIKVDFGTINLDSYDLPVGATLTDFVNKENEFGDGEILEIVEEEIGGQPAISVAIHYTDRDIIGRYYLIQVNDEFLLRFSVAPSQKLLNTPDLIGIRNSLTFDTEAEVPIPSHTPAPPPLGVSAPCIPEYAEAAPLTFENPRGNTACGPDSLQSLEDLTTVVQQYLQDRNTGGLRWEYLIHDPMVIGYWGSEGAVRSPDEFATELANSLYAAGDPGGMTFTTDRSEFPPLAGTPPERLFDPSINMVEIVYSEGWGQDKQGAAILYFAEDECGGFYWYGLAYSNSHFDK